MIQPGFTCMRCSAGIDLPYLHACSYESNELANCLKGAASSQICQSGTAMPDRMAPLLATNRLVSPCICAGTGTDLVLKTQDDF